ncbi:trypsin-like peptidase domain-containing protein [Candidatus Gottesmanbacteria bacterium]|nr:trypsin-like peptidase domain-containing protein [Candidatus Gottesmanbacteria bacterium]
MNFRKVFILLAALLLVAGGLISSGAFGLKFPKSTTNLPPVFTDEGKIKVVNEESVVIDVVDKASPAVVTVGITKTRRVGDIFELNPFDPFSPFRRQQGKTQKVEQDIGSGFIVGADGLVVTNKHVVADGEAKYKVVTKDDKTYEVAKVYRDPANDIAIVKISANNLPTVTMGDSTKIKVGQLAIAIGTALGEFRSTVTTGVISGVGRGIEAGSPFEGYVERLDNVIQTDAAINPGNSGGPLLNSKAEVIGINAAIAGEGQNIGFAIPINVVKDALTNFNQTGQFNRPFLGVQFRIVTRQLSVLNEIPEGAYIVEVVDGSPASKAGLQAEDIITKFDDQKVTSDNDLAKVISKKKVGDTATLTIWRDGKEKTIKVTLGNQEANQ